MSATSVPRDLTDCMVRYKRPSATVDQEDPPPPGASDQERADVIADTNLLRIQDARGVEPKGLHTWDMDTHGFAFAKAPAHPEDLDFADTEWVQSEYYPKILELAKQLLPGSQNGYLFQYQIRGVGDPKAWNNYARFCHADFGPQAVPKLRQDLVERFGVPPAEAETCDFVMINVWHPRFAPAYKQTLALLDWVSVKESGTVGIGAGLGEQLLNPVKVSMRDQELFLCPPGDNGGTEFRDIVRNYSQSVRSRNAGKNPFRGNFSKGAQEKKPPAEAAGGANENTYYQKSSPTNVPSSWCPVYSPKHKWVYISDQKTDETWFFKQYDTRENVAKVAFHTAVIDPVHASNPEIPNRCSVEFRILLTFPPEGGQKSKL